MFLVCRQLLVQMTTGISVGDIYLAYSNNKAFHTLSTVRILAHHCASFAFESINRTLSK